MSTSTTFCFILRETDNLTRNNRVWWKQVLMMQNKIWNKSHYTFNSYLAYSIPPARNSVCFAVHNCGSSVARIQIFLETVPVSKWNQCVFSQHCYSKNKLLFQLTASIKLCCNVLFSPLGFFTSDRLWIWNHVLHNAKQLSLALSHWPNLAGWWFPFA